MSEYQYYEFQAIDRPLSGEAREELRELSTRAKITATSFTNHYEWGDFKGSPRKLVERWFDLHLYLANWGTRQLMMRLPKGLVERERLAPILRDVEWVEIWEHGDDLIVDMCLDEDLEAAREWVEGPGLLDMLASLRADVLSGDLRLFYLLWLPAIEYGLLEDEVREPFAGLGPLNDALEAAADFFSIDPDLVQAAAERDDDSASEIPADALQSAIANLSDAEKTELLLRVVEGAPHVAVEIKRRARGEGAGGPVAGPAAELRSVGDLRRRAAEIESERERAPAARRAEKERRRKKEEERARREMLDSVRQRGDAVWQEIESEIELRNAAAYDRAAALVFALGDIAEEDGDDAAFAQRLDDIRARHARKGRFLDRLKGLGER